MVPDKLRNVSEIIVVVHNQHQILHRLSFMLDLGKSASERVMFLARLKPLLIMLLVYRLH